MEVTFFFSTAPFRVDLIMSIITRINKHKIASSLRIFTIGLGHYEHLKFPLRENPT